MRQELSNVYLAFWNLACKEPFLVSAVRERLQVQNLKPERAQDLPASTAFRRAVEAVRSKEVEAKTWTCKQNGRVRAQFDSIAEDEGRLRRTFVGQYELEEEKPVHIAGQELPEFIPAFEQASIHYTGADISRVIQAILEKDGL